MAQANRPNKYNVSPDIVAPGGTIQLSTNISLPTQINCYIGNNVIFSGLTVTNGSFSLPSSASSYRGSSIYFGTTVDSTFLSSNIIKINSLPTISVVASPSYLTTTSTVYFSVNGSDADLGQNLNLTYSYSTNDVSYQDLRVSGGVFKEASPGSTHYFKVSDGLEATSTSIIVGDNSSIPTFNFSNVTPVTYAALGTTGWVNAVSASITSNSGNILKWKVEYTTDGAQWTSCNLQDIEITNNSFSLPTQYIDAIIRNVGTSSVMWKIRGRVSSPNGLISAVASCPSVGYYYIAGAPTTSAIKMCKQIELRLPIDESIDSNNAKCIAQATISSRLYALNGSFSVDDATSPTQMILTVFFDKPEDVPTGEGSISISFGDKEITKTTTTGLKHYTAPRPANQILQGIPSIIKPFTALSSKIEVSAPNILGSTPSTDYNITVTSNNIKLHLEPSRTTDSGKDIDCTSVSISDGRIKANFNQNQFFTFGTNELGISSNEYAGKKYYNAKLKISNGFGESFDIARTNDQILDFDEAPLNLSVLSTSLIYGTESTTDTSFLEEIPIQEGMKISFPIKFNLYSATSPTFSLRRNGLEVPSSVDVTQFNFASNTNPALNDKVLLTTDAIGEISTTDSHWEVVVTTPGGITTTSLDHSVIQHTARALSLNECVINENGVEWEGSVGGPGTNATDYTEQYNLYIVHSRDSYTPLLYTSLSGFASNKASTASGTSSEYVAFSGGIKVVLGATTTVSSILTTTKTFYSPAINVYKLEPTVAYRPNQLGINTSTPTDGAILDIWSAASNSHIYLRGDNNNYFDINLVDGTIIFNSNGSSYKFDKTLTP